MSSQAYIYNPTERTLAAAGDGFSCPRLTTAGRTSLALTANDKGMMVYDTTLTDLCIWNGAAWEFVSDNSNGFISVKDFGAVGDGVTDDTAAVQSAVTYCIANNVNLLVNGTCLLTSSVNIDRVVDGAAFDKYFTITGLAGGGFIVKSDIAMFSTTLVNVTDPNLPVTQLVMFSNVNFEVDLAARTSYVLNQNKFLRTVFSGCSFSKIKCLYAPANKLIQSIYFTGCNMRRWSGIFFWSDEATFDLKVINCLMEAGGDAFNIDFAVGNAFIGSNIEGMVNYAIKYTGGYGLSVSDCYFEGNGLGAGFPTGCSIDGSAGVGAAGSEVVTVKGCYFSGDSAIPSKPQVRWGDCVAGVSSANLCTTTLHNFTSNSRVDVIGDYGRTAQGNINAYRWFRDKTQQTYGGVIFPAFVGGSGGNLCLRSLNNNIPSTNGLNIDHDGDVITTGNVRQNPAAAILPNVIGEVVLEKTSNTSLTFILKGTDGINRKAVLALVP